MLTFAVQVTEHRERFIEDAAPLFELTPEEVSETPVALVGTVERDLRVASWHRREEYGFSYWVVHEENIEDFAPVVAAMAGK